MRPSAQVERFRMALEVIASGPEWEPGTQVAKIALTDPWVSQEAIAIRDDIDRLSVREAVEQARAEEVAHETTDEDLAEWETTQEPDEEPEDDEPEPIDMAALDAEVDAEMTEKAAAPEPDLPGIEGLSPLALKVLRFVRTNDRVSSAAIRTYLGAGVTDARRKKACADLVERGLIVGEGVSINRRYVPVRQPSAHCEATEAGKLLAAEAEREAIAAVVAKAAEAKVSQDKPTMPDPEPAPSKVEGAGKTPLRQLRRVEQEQAEKPLASDQGRLLESVGFKPGWSIAQHASRLDLHSDKVAAAMRKLEDEGEVRSEAKGGRVVWSLR